jgi:hypothetical protein
MWLASHLRPPLAIAVVFAATPAHGEDAAPSVEIVVAAAPDTFARLQSAIGASERPIRWTRAAQIDPIDVLQSQPPGGGAGTSPAGATPVAPVARVWVDASRSDRLRLYFVNSTTDRFLAREVPLAEKLDEVALETVAQLIDSSVSALLSDAGMGMTRAEMTTALRTDLEARPPPAPTPRLAIAWRPSAGVFYAVQAFASHPLVEHGPGLLGHVDRRDGPWSTGGWLSAQYQFPEHIESPLAGARLDTVALRAGLAIGHTTGGRTEIDVQLGAGADVVHIAPRPGSAGRPTALTADRFAWAPAVQFALVLAGTLAGTGQSHVVLSAAALADVDIGLRHYDVAVDGTLVRVATPWLVRPGIRLEAAWR